MDGPSVLIVEDDSALIRGLKDNFESEGYRVRVARDGGEGLSAETRIIRARTAATF